jgi:hypothetical protein
MRVRSGRSRWITAIAVTLVLFVLVSVGYAAWTFGGLDPGAIPARLRIYGRTYRAPEGAADLTASGVAELCPPTRCLGVLEPALGYWPLVLPWDHPPIPREQTLMQVYLHIAPDRYRAYGIVGGP